MKIGIITFHFPYNCGAALQSYALQSKLEKMGHQVYIINYRPPYHQCRYTPLTNPFSLAAMRFRQYRHASVRKLIKATIGGFYRGICAWRYYPVKKDLNDRFAYFTKNYLHETNRYRSLRDLQRKAPPFDLYIAGSDQLWNPYLTCEQFDKAYFLQFGSPSATRITYAVGANFDQVNDPLSLLPELLKNLDAISLREKKCYNVINACIPEKPTVVTIDPTLLLDKKDYFSICNRNIKTHQHYIVLYTMPDESQDVVYSVALHLSKKEKLTVIDLSPQPHANSTFTKQPCGPLDFIVYFNHADYIITNSFHGTAFSIIFEKQFFVVPHSKTGNRSVELLHKLGADNRWSEKETFILDHIDDKIDYHRVRELTHQCQKEATAFLSQYTETNKY